MDLTKDQILTTIECIYLTIIVIEEKNGSLYKELAINNLDEIIKTLEISL